MEMRDKDAAAGKGPASYFPAIEQRYGRPVVEWLDLIRQREGLTHMQSVAWLKSEHGMGHGHANALVAYARSQAQPGRAGS